MYDFSLVLGTALADERRRALRSDMETHRLMRRARSAESRRVGARRQRAALARGGQLV